VYIRRVLDIFENRKDIGLLAPPEPYGKYSPIWYGDTWRRNFKLTKQLAQELEIDADINREKEVFALGTVFWSRTEALKGLYKKEWNYTDFPCEPMAKDGTVSHAIERIFCYIAQDGGYKTGTIMTEGYAGWLLLNVQEDMRMMFYQMKKRQHVHNLAQVRNLDEFESALKEFVHKYPQIYIYGAGDYGTELYRFFEDRSWACEGFIVSDGKRKELSVLGKRVWEISELFQSDKIGVAIGVSYESRDEVERILSAHGFCNYIYAYENRI
jgi:rhamnosyltransferase